MKTDDFDSGPVIDALKELRDFAAKMAKTKDYSALCYKLDELRARLKI